MRLVIRIWREAQGPFHVHTLAHLDALNDRECVPVCVCVRAAQMYRSFLSVIRYYPIRLQTVVLTLWIIDARVTLLLSQP